MRARKYTDEELTIAVQESRSWSQVLKRIGLKAGGGSYDHVKLIAERLELDSSHFTGKGWNVGMVFRPGKHYSLDEILVENSTYGSHKLRLRLIKEGVFEAKCSKCCGTVWQGEPIPLELDHINGVNDDHRIDNLRLLCPNCHAQTSTYCGKNKKH